MSIEEKRSKSRNKKLWLIFLIIEGIGISMMFGTLSIQNGYILNLSSVELYEYENQLFMTGISGLIIMLIGIAFMYKIPERQFVEIGFPMEII